MPEQTAGPSKVPTASTLSSSSTSTLPNEIVRLIFSHLDKPSLAVCMRASPSFNAIAAPMLYHSVQIVFPSSGQRVGNPFATKREKYGVNPFSIPAQKPWMKRKVKKVASKEQNLKLVRHLSYDDHEHRHCCDPAFSLAGLSSADKIQSIRFNNPKDQLDAPYVVEKGSVPNCHDGICSIQTSLRNGVPAKLVLWPRTALAPRLYPTSDASGRAVASPRNLVVIMMCSTGFNSWRMRQRPHGHGYGELSERVVYIFWTKTPFSSFSDRTPRVDYGHRADRNVQLGGFECTLAIDVWESPAIKEILVVNVESVLYGPNHGRARMKIAREIGDNVRKQKRGDPLKDIKFLSMRQYLTAYDWSGEFTREEVAAWLDATDEDEKRWLEGEDVPSSAGDV